MVQATGSSIQPRNLYMYFISSRYNKMRTFWGAGFTAIICGSLILFISFGIRHGFGLFQQPISDAQGWGRETYSFAIALQNLIWGITVPFVGMVADRYGAPIVVWIGSFLYAGGLWLMSMAGSESTFIIGAGIMIGTGLSGVTFPVIFGTINRLVSPEKRSLAMGLVMALASSGQFAMMPVEMVLLDQFDWQIALVLLSILALFMGPMALGLSEKHKPPPVDLSKKTETGANLRSQQTIIQAVYEAASSWDFWLLTLGFFTCGFQVVFIAIHLPTFIVDIGLPLYVATTALGLIGLFNIIGTYYAGKWGQMRSKPKLLSWLYLARSAVLIIYILLPITALSTYIMAIFIGLLWLSTVPLTNGTLSTIFGVKHMSMLAGFVFFSHQLGSFSGVWLGGYLFDLNKNYDLAWTIMIALGVISCILHWPIREISIEARLNPATATQKV